MFSCDHSGMQQEAARTQTELCSPDSPSLPFLTRTPATQHQCPHVCPVPGSSMHWEQEKTTFHCKERASAKLLLLTTLPTTKHFKTEPNKYTGQIPVPQKEKKNNPTAEFQRQLCSSFSPEQRLPRHLTWSLAAPRRGPHLSLSQPPPAQHRADQNRLRLWLGSCGHDPASLLTKNCFLLLG